MMRHIWGCVQVLVTILGLLPKSAHGNVKAVEARKAMIMDETDKIFNERDADHQIEERGSLCWDCVFPFIYKGRTYRDCTKVGHKLQYKWCATQTDKERNFIDGLHTWRTCPWDCNDCAGKNQRSGSKGCCKNFKPEGGRCVPKNGKWRDWHARHQNMHILPLLSQLFVFLILTQFVFELEWTKWISRNDHFLTLLLVR